MKNNSNTKHSKSIFSPPNNVLNGFIFHVELYACSHATFNFQNYVLSAFPLKSNNRFNVLDAVSKVIIFLESLIFYDIVIILKNQP